MLWIAWMLVYVPVLLLMLLFRVPENIIVPIAIIGALILGAWDIYEIFTGIGSSNTFFGEGKKAKKILETGRSATATIISLDENSKGGVVTINDQPLLNLKLLVDDGEKKPYQVSFDTIIPRSAVPQFQPEAKFKVKIDPTDPQTVVIDFPEEKPGETGEQPKVVSNPMRRNLLIFLFVGIPMILSLPFTMTYLSSQGFPGWTLSLLMFAPVILIIYLFIIPAFKSLTSNTFLGKGKEAKRILQTGYPAKATVLSIGESSGGGTISINDQPYLNIRLLVDDGKKKPYEVSINTLIPRSAVAQFQPGAVFKVKVDPDDPQKIAIDASS